ncbi:hypothetical protein J0H58_12980 [bacterium]|nr:hypothetical protein [bacterium]
MGRRVPTRLGVLILLTVVGVPLAGSWWRVERSRAATEAESFAALSAAGSPVELREVVGQLGVVLDVRGGGWVAVRYRDSHAAPGWSSAVARDSGGGWWVSREHFCGQFAIHRELRGRGEEGAADLRAVEEAGSLEAARAVLAGIGFRPVSPP